MNIATSEGMRQAIAWQTGQVNLIKEGGAWIVPRSGTVIKIYGSKKIAVFVTGIYLEPDIVKVFKAMGWVVADKEPGQDNPDQKAFAE